MAPTERELERTRACMQFVDDLMKFASDHYESDDPPPVPFDGVSLNSDFGRNFLHYVRTRSPRGLDREVREVLLDIESLGPAGPTVDTLFLYVDGRYDYLEDKSPGGGCFMFLADLCTLCLACEKAGRQDCAKEAREIAKRVVARYPTFYENVMWVAAHADSFRYSR